MPKERFGAEQIVTLLRQIEVLMAWRKSAPDARREAGTSEQKPRDESVSYSRAPLI